VGRLGSRIRTVGPAFPSQGPTGLVGLLAGTVLERRRIGVNPVVRGRIVRSADDVPQFTMDLKPPYFRPRDLGPGPTGAAAVQTSSQKVDDGGCVGCG
jgi:hypothetical protein